MINREIINKELLKLDLKLLKKQIILITPLSSLSIIGIWLFMHLTNKPIEINTFHVDYAYILTTVINPLGLIISTYFGYYTNKKYYQSGVNELIYTQKISKLSHYITHLVSIGIVILINFILTTITIVIVGLIFQVFTMKLIILQLVYLISMILSFLVSYCITTITKNESSTFYNWIIPSVIFIHKILEAILVGLNNKTLKIINNVLDYINYFGFIKVDIEALNVEDMVSIDYIHLSTRIVVIFMITIISYYKFKNKEMIK